MASGWRRGRESRASRRRPVFRISAVFDCISAGFARDSTFNRSTGSVLLPRRLKRQSANSMLTPSVRSIFASFVA